MASKRKTSLFACLCLLVVGLGLAENRAWGFFQSPQPAPGQIALSSPEGIEENYHAWQYDAPGYAVAPKTVGKIDDTASAATTVGRQGQQHSFPNPKAPRPRNTPGTVNGRDYTGHALDRIQERGLTPSVVEDTIKHGVPSTGRGGATIYRSGQATVILNPNGSVKTVY